MRTIIDKKYIDNIPILEIYKDDGKDNKPLIFIMHGLGSSKERNIEYGYKLSQEGFFAISFDSYMHGEQETEEFKNADSFEKFFKVFDVVMETTKYINICIDFYKSNPNIDINRVGLVGVSMGGFIIYNYLAKNKRDNVKAAVPIISSPYWSHTSKEFANRNPRMEKYLDEETIEYIEDIEPIKSLMLMKDFPLLMLNGAKDELISIYGVRKSFDMLKENYCNKDKIKLIEYKDIGHERTSQMIVDVCSWLKKFI
ncbi:alpha/beta hydrolase family protein [Maledivibacter halophilus]|uniref:Serine aminopeptidase, S33 n=1 Tax=Maledivibacter halophilus TaxID=36842 RepID=A0A1T5MUA6_9FIRM|nr:alpha/beta hydrolase [Maledivibacter halophilus]SKC91775.1 Serine aminopeptidase, S33 [Maledivibacter halophilus]